jgi:PAS domain-containing protein
MASFWISQNQTRRWTPEEASSMRLIAERVWSVIDRAWAEDTLRASEARFRATFENAAVGIAHVAVDGRWLRVNDRLCEIVGYSREQLLAGMTFQDIRIPRIWTSISSSFARWCRASGRPTRSTSGTSAPTDRSSG